MDRAEMRERMRANDQRLTLVHRLELEARGMDDEYPRYRDENDRVQTFPCRDCGEQFLRTFTGPKDGPKRMRKVCPDCQEKYQATTPQDAWRYMRNSAEVRGVDGLWQMAEYGCCDVYRDVALTVRPHGPGVSYSRPPYTESLHGKREMDELGRTDDSMVPETMKKRSGTPYPVRSPEEREASRQRRLAYMRERKRKRAEEKRETKMPLIWEGMD